MSGGKMGFMGGMGGMGGGGRSKMGAPPKLGG